MVTKVAVLGASGNAGSEIVKELASRSTYEVTAIARDTTKIPEAKGVKAVKGDASQPEEIAALLKGSDVVVSALHHDIKEPSIIKALNLANVSRTIIVGGAASLLVSPDGPRVFDTPDFPEEYKPFAIAGIEFLDELKTEKKVDWSFFSPPLEIGPGPRTGKFRTGDRILIVDDQGNSSISFADYAIALVDELEAHKHPFAQFTAGY